VSEILPDYADVLAETGTCLQEADEDHELPERAALPPLSLSLSLSVSLSSPVSLLDASISIFPFVVRSASSSVIVLFRREFRGGFFRHGSPAKKQTDLGCEIVINDTRKEDTSRCRLYYPCTVKVLAMRGVRAPSRS